MLGFGNNMATAFGAELSCIKNLYPVKSERRIMDKILRMSTKFEVVVINSRQNMGRDGNSTGLVLSYCYET